MKSLGRELQFKSPSLEPFDFGVILLVIAKSSPNFGSIPSRTNPIHNGVLFPNFGLTPTLKTS